MVKEFLMKKLLISLGVFACVTVNAQIASDSVVMTVARPHENNTFPLLTAVPSL